MDYTAKVIAHPACAEVLAALERNGRQSVAVGGLAAGAASLFVAALRRELRRPVFTVAATAELAEAFAVDGGAYAGEAVALLEPPGVIALKPVSPGLATSAARIETLLAMGEPRVWGVAAAAACGRRLPPPAELRQAVRRYRVGDELDLGEVETYLGEVGYERVGMVEGPGQFARRGALLDVFVPGAAAPFRLELFGDTLESVRVFDVWTQRRAADATTLTIPPIREVILTAERVTRALRVIRERFGEDATQQAYEALDVYRYFDGVENLLPFFYESAASVADYMEGEPLLVIYDEDAVAAAMDPGAGPKASPGFPFPGAEEILLSLDELQRAFQDKGGSVLTVAAGPAPAGVNFSSRGVEHLSGQLGLFVDEVRAFRRRGDPAVVVERPEQIGRFRDIIAGHDAALSLDYDVRASREGFIWPEVGLAIFPAWRILARRPPGKKRSRPPRFVAGKDATRVASPFDLVPGNVVVHADHGVGRFEGLATLPVDGHDEEFVKLTYARGDRLYVPVSKLGRVYKYVGPDAEKKALDQLGGAAWRRARRRAEKSAEELARQLVEIYAARAARAGHAFAGDAAWEAELADNFPYVETPDQLRAVEEVACDMARAEPMDRLVCGDVGFGKTEVAVRAALTTVADGKQVAVLVPTTILADQHYATFRDRLDAFPVRVEMLSRFRTPKEQKTTLVDLAAGKVDVIIGTHRLLSRDVSFADLGLLVVDEEQRFGVGHKEKVKQLRKLVDVLTLTATPIPRTLYMALAGIRDLSLIGTAPLERLPIHTVVAPFDEDIITDAIRRELGRGGQVFFVHNRVKTIDAVAFYLAELVPEGRFAVAHGQLRERELERIMHDFAAARFDVLVSSAIIEAGLDFPNVNTLIINRADTFGLSQLHQLRGRVGRSHLRAYAYLLTPASRALTDAARRRLQALKDAAELGAGFRLAMRDLEIRGAGNLLGPQQSGAAAAVGLDLYAKILADAVAELKGEELPPAEVAVRPGNDAVLPPSYVPDERLRLAIYRRLSVANAEEVVDDLAAELRDRFGPLPRAVARLLTARKLHLVGARAGATAIEIEGPAAVTVEFGEGELERLAAVRLPAEVVSFDVTRRGAQTAVKFAVAGGAEADEAVLAFLRRLAAGP